VKITDPEPAPPDDGLIPASRFYCESADCLGYDRPIKLVVQHPRGSLCAACWHRKGEPGLPPCTPHEAEMARQGAVAKMQARKGAHAHLVRKGLT
jgi:hypothetical protein